MNFSVEETQFSECKQYRYTLRRHSLVGSKQVCFVMLNPSTADVQLDDPTTLRAGSFAQRLGAGEYLAVNLFALRSTDPKKLKMVDDPVGPLNDKYLLEAARWADVIVIAWGNGGAYKNRYKEVLEIIRFRTLLCLGKTKDGYPKFPLYLAADTKFEIFSEP